MKTLSRILLLTAVLMGSAGLQAAKLDYSARTKLVLNQTRLEEAEKLFGKPMETRTRRFGSSTYKLLHYENENSALTPRTYMRKLTLEFKDGVLNGFFGGSSYKGEEVSLFLQDYEQIVEGSTSRDDLMKKNGFPTAWIQFPSYLAGELQREHIIEFSGFRSRLPGYPPAGLVPGYDGVVEYLEWTTFDTRVDEMDAWEAQILQSISVFVGGKEGKVISKAMASDE